MKCMAMHDGPVHFRMELALLTNDNDNIEENYFLKEHIILL